MHTLQETYPTLLIQVALLMRYYYNIRKWWSGTFLLVTADGAAIAGNPHKNLEEAGVLLKYGHEEDSGNDVDSQSMML